MKIAILRGPFLNPWEMQNYENIPNVTYIGSNPRNYEFDKSPVFYPKMYNNILFRSLGLSYYQPSLSGILKNFDIVNSVESYHTFSLISALSGKKFVFTQWETLPNFMAYRYPQKKLISKYVIEKSDLIHAVTKKAANCIISKGANKDKVFVQPYGVNTEKFKPENPAKYRKSLNLENDIVILFIGRLVREKGIPELIEAYKTLKEKAKLIICGNGPLKIPPEVINIPGLSYSEVPYLHASSDILCLPSVPNKNWEEQFGFVLIEAMASGKPVVATESGAIPEIVENEENGFLVQPGNVDKLRDALEYLIDNESEIKKIGMRNRKKVLDKFDAKKVSSILYEKYIGLMND